MRRSRVSTRTLRRSGASKFRLDVEEVPRNRILGRKMAVSQCTGAVPAVEDACFSGRGNLPRRNSAPPRNTALVGVRLPGRNVQRVKAQVAPRSEYGETGVTNIPPQRDMQTAARLRLHSLINRVQGDGEQEMLEDILLSEPPESKMLLALLSGSVICGGAFFVCWLSGSSPTGGAHLSLESCQAAGLGLLASLPLAGLKAATWTDGARRSFPALQDMQEREADVLKPLLERMSATQVAVVMMAEALPTLLMLLPAAQGALTLSLCTYADYLRDVGVNVPYNLPAALALITTASLAALARYLEHGISGEEYEAVDAAVRNADRYYRLTATNVSGRQDDAERMARAFKVEAASWVHRQQMAGNVAGLMAAFEVTFLGMLWRATGDLSAPAAACLMLHGVGFASLHRFAFQKRK